MALSEKHRSSIYQGLLQFLGEEEAQALLSQFPARDLDEPVTKEFVRAEISEVRSELRTEIADLRSAMHQGFGAIRADMHERFREMTMWVAGALIAGLGVSAGIGAGIAALAG
jgi:hypothetical protein